MRSYKQGSPQGKGHREWAWGAGRRGELGKQARFHGERERDRQWRACSDPSFQTLSGLCIPASCRAGGR